MEVTILTAVCIYFTLIILVNVRVLFNKKKCTELTYSFPFYTMLILMLYWIIALEREINIIVFFIIFTVTLIVVTYRYINKIRVFEIYSIKKTCERDVMNLIDRIVDDNIMGNNCNKKIIFKRIGIRHKIIFKNYNDYDIQTCLKEICKYQRDGKKEYILPMLLIFISIVLIIALLNVR